MHRGSAGRLAGLGRLVPHAARRPALLRRVAEALLAVPDFPRLAALFGGLPPGADRVGRSVFGKQRLPSQVPPFFVHSSAGLVFGWHLLPSQTPPFCLQSSSAGLWQAPAVPMPPLFLHSSAGSVLGWHLPAVPNAALGLAGIGRAQAALAVPIQPFFLHSSGRARWVAGTACRPRPSPWPCRHRPGSGSACRPNSSPSFCIHRPGWSAAGSACRPSSNP